MNGLARYAPPAQGARIFKSGGTGSQRAKPLKIKGGRKASGLNPGGPS